jgi:antitoxin MazE
MVKEIAMLAELKDKSQVTIPKSVVNELGLQKGDLFDVVVEGGKVLLVPVVVYPKEKVAKLEALAAEAEKERRNGDAKLYDDVDKMTDDLDNDRI